MPAKEIKFSTDARTRMLAVIDILTDAGRITLGPKGRNVILDKSFGAPRITKDGVTVAKEIELTDKFENMGAQMVREVASKTNDEAGDGTTTATVLAHSIVREGAKSVAAGMNPMDLKRGVDLAVKTIVEALKKADTAVVAARKAADPPAKALADASGKLAARQKVATPLIDSAAKAVAAAGLLPADKELAGLAAKLDGRAKKIAGEVVAMGRRDTVKTGDTLAPGKGGAALARAEVLPSVLTLAITAANRSGNLTGGLGKKHHG